MWLSLISVGATMGEIMTNMQNMHSDIINSVIAEFIFYTVAHNGFNNQYKFNIESVYSTAVITDGNEDATSIDSD